MKATEQLENDLVEAQEYDDDNREVDHDVSLWVLHKKWVTALHFLVLGIGEGAVAWQWERIINEILHWFEI